MSAALQLPMLWAGHTGYRTGCQIACQSGSMASSPALQPQLLATAVHHIQRRAAPTEVREVAEPSAESLVCYAFYRKHTENLLRRYLYASMQVGRSPNLLGDSVGRGWVSSRRVRTFEDALIFVLDVERCLGKLSLTDRKIVTRVCIQEYTQAETAVLLRTSTRNILTRLPIAIDRLTQILVTADLLVLPD